jgi:hypothetical protein
MVMMPGTLGEGDDVSCSQGSRHLSLSLSLLLLLMMREERAVVCLY